MAWSRAAGAAFFAALTVVLVAFAPTHSATTLLAAVAVVFLAAVLVSQASALTAASRSAHARSAAFVRRQERSPEPAPQHPDTAGRPRTRAPSMRPRAV